MLLAPLISSQFAVEVWWLAGVRLQSLSTKLRTGLLSSVRCRECETLEARLREQLEAAQARAGEAEADARALREQKYGLDARVSELSHKLGAAEGSNRWVRVGQLAVLPSWRGGTEGAGMDSHRAPAAAAA